MRPLIALALLSGIAVAQNGPCSEKSIQDQLAKPDAASIWADDAYFFSRAIETTELFGRGDSGFRICMMPSGA